MISYSASKFNWPTRQVFWNFPERSYVSQPKFVPGSFDVRVGHAGLSLANGRTVGRFLNVPKRGSHKSSTPGTPGLTFCSCRALKFAPTRKRSEMRDVMFICTFVRVNPP